MMNSEAPREMTGEEIDSVSGGSLWSTIVGWFTPKQEPFPCSPGGDSSRCLATVVKG